LTPFATHRARERGPEVRPGSPRAWRIALRPRSLLLAVSPVLVAVALVHMRTGLLAAGVLVLALCVAVLMQAIANLQNDAGHTARGGSGTAAHVGLPRATTHGWLTVAQVRIVIAACIGLALATGLPLVLARGWPAIAIGAASLGAALAYMGGPRPIAYTPLGELFVFVFFGLVATAGTDYAIVGGMPPASTWIAACALGLLSAAALLVNNCRDVDHDVAVGRRTLPIAVGLPAARRLYAGALLVPFGLAILLAWLTGAPGLSIPLLVLPAAGKLARDFAACPPGPAYNGILMRTFGLTLWYAAGLVIGSLTVALRAAT
jgi:1,4-dihydroxy-2-naphthoate polyprenyltransferase